jgi:2-oxo-4-hydroxy-4-carboxy-5-ureidoimidazoline decarboxylase
LGARAVITAPHALVNALAPEEARQALMRCCGSTRWVAAMLARRPFASDGALYAAADDVWRSLAPADFLEAFAHHPRIGDRSGGALTAATSAWSAEEQARAAAGPAETAAALRALNDAYAARFGHIFIICATGKSAEEILAALRARLPNDPETELGIAAAEQGQITRLRLEKLAR